MVTGTPAGERHELGALLAAVTAAAGGWRGLFLGPDLPADEIAAAALRLEARLVALSVVNPTLSVSLPDEIRDLRSRLPAGVGILVGGPPAVAMRELLTAEGVGVMDDLDGFRRVLRNEEEGIGP